MHTISDAPAPPSPAAPLYIHIPFCRSKCAYCDFFSAPARGGDNGLYERYTDALLAEWRMRKNELPSLPSTIYLGGGTPSLLPMPVLKRLMDALLAEIPRRTLLEATIEANPEDVTPRWLEGIHKAGFNRVSIGIQSFDASELAAVERRHSPLDSIRALTTLAENGWNHSADLIYGLPGQTLESWCRNLDRLLAFRPPHLSAYLLSYEPGTRLYARMAAGKVAETDEDTAQQMYDYLCRRTAEEGYLHYEISNFALPGRHAIHNSAYWNLTPYLGLGCSAHSLDKDSVRRYNPLSVKEYIHTLLSAPARIAARVDPETPSNRFNDLVITALRTSAGLRKDAIPDTFRTEFQVNLRPLLASGAVTDLGDSYAIPASRWLTADSILRDLIVT